MKRTQGLIPVLLCPVLLALGCAGDSGDGPGPAGTGVRVSGQIGRGYQVAASQAGGLSRVESALGEAAEPPVGPDAVVDRVVALRVNRGSLNAGSRLQGLVADVDPDGTFVLDLDRTADWVLVLVDSQAEGADRFVGSVQFDAEADAGNGLLAIPVSAATVDRLDLGTLSRTMRLEGPADATTSQQAAPPDFGMTTDQLALIAKTDDVFRNARNIVANHDDATGTWYTVLPAFTWHNASPVVPGFSDPAAGRFDGYAFQLDTNSPGVTIQQICGEGVARVDVGLYPPTDVEALIPPGAAYGPSRGLANDAVTACTVQGGATLASDSDFFAGAGAGLEDRTVSYGFSGVQFPYPIAAGDWTWREAGTVRATFDLGVAAPTAADGVQAGFVPSIRLAPADDGRVSSVEFRWFYWDEATGAYLPVDAGNLDLLAHTIGQVEVAAYELGHDTDTAQKVQFDPAVAASVPIADSWYLGVEPPTGGKRLARINVVYETGGIGRVLIFTGLP